MTTCPHQIFVNVALFLGVRGIVFHDHPHDREDERPAQEHKAGSEPCLEAPTLVDRVHERAPAGGGHALLLQLQAQHKPLPFSCAAGGACTCGRHTLLLQVANRA